MLPHYKTSAFYVYNSKFVQEKLAQKGRKYKSTTYRIKKLE